jgi:hypothetical protein
VGGPPALGLSRGLTALHHKISVSYETIDRLCGLVVSVEDYKHRGPGFDSWALLRIFLISEGVGSGTGSTQPRDRIN